MKAIVFGPGRIGCGFAGQLLKSSGYDLVFVGRNRVMVDHLNRVGRYRVRLIGREGIEETTVDGLRAISTSESDRIAEEIADADLVVTAVGCPNLLGVSPLVGAGILKRKLPLNVLAFENLGNSSSCLLDFTRAVLRGGSPPVEVGFTSALVSRIVARRTGDPALDEPLVFIGDPPATFIVDGRWLRPPIPRIVGMLVKDNYEAWVQKKLFTFSAGHATAAYLGYLKGYHFIHTAMCDPEIKTVVLEAMREGQQGLSVRYGPEIAGDEKDLEDIMARFENSTLDDPIDRVGRDPLRKLGAEDRLIGPARLARQAGVSPAKLMLAAAAAMFFCPRNDEAAVKMKRDIEEHGFAEALNKVSGLDPAATLGRLVTREWCRLAESHPDGLAADGTPLLSLDQFFWA